MRVGGDERVHFGFAEEGGALGWREACAPCEEEVGQGHEAQDGGVVVCECEVEAVVLAQGVLEEDEGGERGAAAHFYYVVGAWWDVGRGGDCVG